MEDLNALVVLVDWESAVGKCPPGVSVVAAVKRSAFHDAVGVVPEEPYGSLEDFEDRPAVVLARVVLALSDMC